MYLNKKPSIAVLSLLLFTLLSPKTIANESEHGIVGIIIPDTGRYTAIDKSFSITLPVKGTQQYLDRVITDTVSARGTTIVIEPAKNAGVYRLEIRNAIEAHQRKETFPKASKKAFDWYRRFISHTYNENLVELISQPFKINGREAASVIYKQASSANKGPRYHLFYLVDFDDKLAFLWINIALEEDNLEIEDKIITGASEQSKKSIAMLRSLVF